MAFPKEKYAWTDKMGEKGKMGIPKEAREVFGIEPGDTLLVLGDKKQGIAIPPKDMMSSVIAQIFGAGAPKEDGGE